MKIVIDIPEEDHEFIKDLNAVMGGRVSCKTIQYNVINAIKNGTPVKTGEWIEDELHNVVCSICGGIMRDCRVDYINYCNKCGAKMKGEKNET